MDSSFRATRSKRKNNNSKAGRHPDNRWPDSSRKTEAETMDEHPRGEKSKKRKSRTTREFLLRDKYIYTRASLKGVMEKILGEKKIGGERRGRRRGACSMALE